MIQTSYVLNNRQCRVTLAEQTFHSQPQGFTYPKGSPIVSIIDNEYVKNCITIFFIDYKLVKIFIDLLVYC